MPHISLSAEQIGAFMGFPITNALLATWISMILIALFSYFATRNMSMIPSRFQTVTEGLIGGLYDFFTKVTGKHTKQFFPLIASIFIFIIVNNWLGLFPGVSSIGLHVQETVSDIPVSDIHEEEVALDSHDEQGLVSDSHIQDVTVVDSIEHDNEKHSTFVPIFRGATADLNTTLALAIVAVVSIQYFGLKSLGHSYLKKFINFKNPIDFFIGILEIISEFAKVVSFAFRLFGNIFAGEVLITVIAFLIPLIAPLPFIGLEIFVGFIQALVFAMLTAVFLQVAVQHE